jgi:hypothetical protein
MAIAIDAVNFENLVGNAGAGPFVMDPINPAANSLIVVIIAVDYISNPCTATVSDNQSHTYTRHARSNTNGDTEIWSYYTTSALTNLSVTVTFTNAWNSTNTGAVYELVFTGAQGIQPGTTNSATSNTVSITPQATGSYIVGGYISADTPTTPTALNANTTILQSVNGGTGNFTLASFRSTSTTASLSTVSYGTSASIGTQQDIVAVEILANNFTGLVPAPFITA